MRTVSTVLTTTVILLCFLNGLGAQTMDTSTNSNGSVIFSTGSRAPAEYFTGTAWASPLVPKDDTFNCPTYNVTFEPGARNNWHKHPGGQILLITGGIGYYQERGKPVQVLHAGDVVKIHPNVEHWHGATPKSRFTHIAISTNIQKGDAMWLERVSDEEYTALSKSGERKENIRISEAARKNHEELFPGHISTLKVTDPELIEVFDNFTFDEVLRHGKLETKSRLMVILASLIASQALSEYKIMVGGALNVGVTPAEIKEILYQAVPYVGIAKVFDFIHATNEVLEDRGVKLPLESQTTTTPETRYAKGLELQKAIFGDMIEKMYKESPEGQIHIQKLLSANCFGDYLTRKGLDVRTRELLTFSMLLSLGGCEPQLKGHIQGNINVGNDKKLLLSAITQLIPYVGYPRALNAIRCLNETIPEEKKSVEGTR